jgi:hypothetical protein
MTPEIPSCRTRISYRDALRSPREVSEDLPDIAEAEVDDAYLHLEVEGMANVCAAALLAASGALRGEWLARKYPFGPRE